MKNRISTLSARNISLSPLFLLSVHTDAIGDATRGRSQPNGPNGEAYAPHDAADSTERVSLAYDLLCPPGFVFLSCPPFLSLSFPLLSLSHLFFFSPIFPLLYSHYAFPVWLPLLCPLPSFSSFLPSAHPLHLASDHYVHLAVDLPIIAIPFHPSCRIHLFCFLACHPSRFFPHFSPSICKTAANSNPKLLLAIRVLATTKLLPALSHVF